MYVTSHQRMRTKRILIETAAGKYRTVRTARPARTNDRRKAVTEQMGGAR